MPFLADFLFFWNGCFISFISVTRSAILINDFGAFRPVSITSVLFSNSRELENRREWGFFRGLIIFKTSAALRSFKSTALFISSKIIKPYFLDFTAFFANPSPFWVAFLCSEKGSLSPKIFTNPFPVFFIWNLEFAGEIIFAGFPRSFYKLYY